MNHGIQNFNYQEKICLNIEIDDAKSMLKCFLHTQKEMNVNTVASNNSQFMIHLYIQFSKEGERKLNGAQL